jgi:hypothetical protein
MIETSIAVSWPRAMTTLRHSMLACVALFCLNCGQKASSPDEAETISVGRQAVGANVVLRKAGTDYQLELSRSSGFPPRAFDPLLRIGAQVFSRYQPMAGYLGIVFPISSAEFAAINDGELITISYGKSDPGPESFGVLNKAAVVP